MASRADLLGPLRGMDRRGQPEHGRQSGIMAVSSASQPTPGQPALVVSPLQVEPPSDYDSTGDRHTVQLVHLCEYICSACFSASLAVSAGGVADRHNR